MAPRGIVAAATASTFSAALVAKNIGGASKILPVTFLVIVVTVALYGLTAVPVARRLGVTRPARTRPLLVGGEDWVVDLGRALGSLGLEVLMWAGLDEQRERIRQAGLELAPGELLAAATGRGAQLEGITAVLLLTDEDDFNALGSTVLRAVSTARSTGWAPGCPAMAWSLPTPAARSCSATADQVRGRRAICGRGADRHIRRRRRGARRHDLLFLVRADGRLAPVTLTGTPAPHAGDTIVSLGPALAAQPADASHSGLPGAERQ